MSKALKTFIILNLVAGISLAVLGTLLFMEKELIKGRALLLRATISDLASNLKWGEEIADFEVEAKQSRAYSLSKPTRHSEIAGYKRQLEDLTGFATGRLGQLEGTHQILVSTEDTLRDTQDTLATRERELADARTEIARLEGRIDETQTALAQTNNQIATLRGNIASLETRRDRLSGDLTARNNEIAGLEIDLTTTIEERDIALDRYKRCRVGSENEEVSSGEWRGRAASILQVNDNWNYVVLDKGLVDELKPDLQAYVHRGNEYVAKLQVTDVKQGVAIARILPGSVAEGVTLKTGDTIFF
jgi:DNA repair exonuclease SbcCD ATPase subunit